ncbi:MAG: hypothetical protein NTY38_00750, partial [Acidobacteria bacterium]|nr:hypothetical protein [Acidobacteriota bacterium]
LYYSTYPTRHLTGDLSKPLPSFTARAIWRLDGFTSADAAWEGGEFTTPLLTFRGSKLELNAQTGGGGFIRVEILNDRGQPVAGYSAGDAKRLVGNSLHHVASWNAGTGVEGLAGKPVRLRFIMRDAKLYAFQFVP